MSLRGVPRRSSLNPRDGRLLRFARNDMRYIAGKQLGDCPATEIEPAGTQPPLSSSEGPLFVKKGGHIGQSEYPAKNLRTAQIAAPTAIKP